MTAYKKNHRRALALTALLLLMSITVFGCRDNTDPSSSAKKSSSPVSSLSSASEAPIVSTPESVPSTPSSAVSSRAISGSVSSGTSSKPIPSVPAPPSSTGSSSVAPPKVEVDTTNILVSTVNPSLNIDLTFHKNSPEPTPIAILFHGGNWSAEDHSYTSLGNLEHYKEKLVEKGFAVASCEYIRAATPQNPSPGKNPKPTDNAVLIMKFILSMKNSAEYFFNPENVILIGENAGGYTALMAALGGEKFQTASGKDINISAVITISSILDLDELMSLPNEGKEKLTALQEAAEGFTGEEYSLSTSEKYKKLSPAKLFLNKAEGLYIFGVLSNDLAVYSAQSTEVVNANPDIDIFKIIEDNHNKLWDSIDETLEKQLSFDE